MKQKKIPVILDTDIGTDIDDTWALVALLNSPELDVKLIVTEHGNTEYRAKIVAKMLEIAERTDIPIGIGIPFGRGTEAQAAWVEGYRLDHYPGVIHRNGVEALVQTIMSQDEQVAVIAIGPVTNLAHALRLQPKIVEKARFIGMQGSIYQGYEGNPQIAAEYNVRIDAGACREVFAAPWDVLITPLDTCGHISLSGQEFQKIRQCPARLARMLVENNDIWSEFNHKKTEDYQKKSSILYDTVAIYMAISENLLDIQNLGIVVTDDGYIKVDPSGKKIRCAIHWKDRAAFDHWLVARICAG